MTDSVLAWRVDQVILNLVLNKILQESRRCYMGQFAYFLNRVRYTTKSGTVKTYRVDQVLEIGPDDPPLGDPVYEKYAALGDSEREAMELGGALMCERRIR
jgi:hypothetical protein